MPAGQYVQGVADSPFAHQAYGALAAKYVPRNAMGAIAPGWKAASGLKGGAIGLGSNLLGNYLKPKEQQPTFGGEFGNITDKYQRRLQTAGPGILGGAVKGAGQGAQYGGWYGAAGGALAGAIYGGAKKHAKTAYSDFLPDSARGAITDAYREYLGRDPEAGAVEGYLKNLGWKPGDKGVGEGGVNYALGQIKNSQEARQRSGVPGGGINTAPRAPVNFSPSAIPSSFLSPEKVQMLDETRKRQLGY
jgi:hypothetical protein